MGEEAGILLGRLESKGLKVAFQNVGGGGGVSVIPSMNRETVARGNRKQGTTIITITTAIITITITIIIIIVIIINIEMSYVPPSRC